MAIIYELRKEILDGLRLRQGVGSANRHYGLRADDQHPHAVLPVVFVGLAYHYLLVHGLSLAPPGRGEGHGRQGLSKSTRTAELPVCSDERTTRLSAARRQLDEDPTLGLDEDGRSRKPSPPLQDGSMRSCQLAGLDASTASLALSPDGKSLSPTVETQKPQLPHNGCRTTGTSPGLTLNGPKNIAY